MELLMQYIWQHRLWLPADMTTVDGCRVEVIDPGLLNTGPGPDFFNAKIRIGSRIWAGNVEMHVRASDWHRHGHDRDRAYDTVILHVVARDDCRILRPGGEEIPQLVMPCASDFSTIYNEMVNDPVSQLPCARHIASLPRIYITDWLTALAFERLYQKSDRVARYVGDSAGDWGEAIYIVLARALGFGTNSDTFERVARQTPLRKLLRHRGDTNAIEGALFGQAGLLDNIPDDSDRADYTQRLKQDYAFMSAKYGFQHPVSVSWRMGRMRPQNFPHRRIAALAQMVSDGFTIGYDLLHAETEADVRALFDVRLHQYWKSHYNFNRTHDSDTQWHPGEKALSKTSVNTLIINVAAPVMHAYGTITGHSALCERAVELLQSIAPENNSIIRLFESAGIDCPDAFTSQALIQLRRNYCEPRKCLYCRIGHRYLATRAIRRDTGVDKND